MCFSSNRRNLPILFEYILRCITNQQANKKIGAVSIDKCQNIETVPNKISGSVRMSVPSQHLYRRDRSQGTGSKG